MMDTHIETLIKGKIPGPLTGIQVKKTICAICEGGATSCGVNAYIQKGKVIKVEGMPEFPQNRGTLCAKGNALRQYIYSPDRIRTPLKRIGRRGEGRFKPISWKSAFDEIAQNLLSVRAQYGPESVVFGVGYTKWLRPFAQRLALSFGTPNFASESSTCFHATQIAAKLTYGCWGVPDIQNSNGLLVWSRNAFVSGTPHSKKLLAAHARGLKIIEVNPMVTHLTRYADLHLGLRPGTDGALALSMAHVIIDEGLYDQEFVAQWTVGFDAFRTYVRQFRPEKAEKITGVPATLIYRAARLFAKTKPAAIMTSASPTVHHTNGVQNHRAIICLSGLTGNFDTPGGNFHIPETWLHVGTGIPTRHHAFTFPRDLKTMPPRIGQKKFPLWAEFVNEAQAMELATQIDSASPYPIKAILAFGFNQRMWPGNDQLLKSLQKVDFFANIDLFMTDTAKMADIVLPACSSFERSELRFYPAQHVIYTQPVIAPLGQSKSDSDIIFELARRIAPHDQLLQQGYEACLDWILAPSGLTIEQLKKYPAGLTIKNVSMPEYRKYESHGFATPSGKMEFASGRLQATGYDALPVYKEPVLSPVETPSLARPYPLVLTTGARVPMFIHSRTFRNNWNLNLYPAPTLSLNTEDAAARAIAHGDDVLLKTPRHTITVRAHVTNTIQPGTVHIYHGWTQIEVNQLIEPDYLDPVSGFPGFKSLICEVEKSGLHHFRRPA